MLLYFASQPVKCNFLEYDMPYGRKEESKKERGGKKGGGKRHVSKGLVIHSFEKIITYPLILPWLACL